MADRPTLLIVPDGVADWNQPEFDDRTPLEVASTPNLDQLVEKGQLYRLENIPPECNADSGIANMSLLGYDPREFYRGRGPIEALNLGVDLHSGEVAYRCNLVTVTEGVLEDYSADNISTEISRELFRALDREFAPEGVRFIPGIRYRGVLVIEGEGPANCFPPHDEMGRSVEELWPGGPGHALLRQLMEDSRPFLRNYVSEHPDLKPGGEAASMIWPWGGGSADPIPSVRERYERDGHVVAGVDLINGLGIAVGMTKESVPGATGDYNTDMRAKALRGLEVMDSDHLVYIHVEATDEAGHEGNARKKVEMIEKFDRELLDPVLDALRTQDFEILLGPDHYTPIQLRTHVGDPVPFLVVNGRQGNGTRFTERQAEKGPIIEKGWDALAQYYREDTGPLAS